MPFVRAVCAAGVLALALAATSLPAGAQTDATDPGATVVPPSPNATTTTTISCPNFAGPDVQFIGTATSVGDTVARFHVDRLEGGALAVNDVEVDYPDDAGFLKQGTQYRVPALRDTESGRFVSKVRALTPDRNGMPEACAERDPVLTTLANGGRIDTGLFSALHGKGGRIAWAFLLPTLLALAVLVVLVGLKHVVTWTFNRLVHHPERPAGP